MPVVILTVIAGAGLFALTDGDIIHSFDPPTAGVVSWIIVASLVFFVVLVPFIYLVYRWYVNFRWKDVSITWDTSFWPACGFILGQLLLTIVTIGIYWPAALLKLFRYFADKTVFTRGETVIGRLQFEGDLQKGFGLLWGQALLSVITLGVYIPWAVEKAGTWVASSTCYEKTGNAPY